MPPVPDTAASAPTGSGRSPATHSHPAATIATDIANNGDRARATPNPMVLDYRNMSPVSRVCATLVRIAMVAGVACSGALCAPRKAVAQAAQDRERAAAAFDDAVRAYERGDFARAAAGFLRADESVPNTETLTNALSAARRANEFLLVIEAAGRLLSRADAADEAKVQARRARAEAASRLARVTFSCSPSPCALALDDGPIEPGERFVLPGVHRVDASAPTLRSVSRTLALDAGATYSVGLALDAAADTTPSAPTKQQRPSQTAARSPSAATAGAGADGLAPTWFYVGAGVTVALAGVTTWSGLDALASKRALGASPTQSQVDDVKTRMRRTDLWLGGTVVVAAFTGWAGLQLVRWNDTPGSAGSIALVPTGPGVTLRGHF